MCCVQLFVCESFVFNLYPIVFQIKSQATAGFQTFIIHYREDPDQQNLIDWIQEDWVC